MTTTTNRATAPGIEAVLGKSHPVLDHGFVRVVDYMGDDAAIVQAARVSYGAGTKTARDDEGLIRYLMRNWHSSPFEMCEIKLHVKLPIFVARQWLRHRTASVNEYSARYSVLDREFYIPAPDALAAQSTANNQGRGQVLEGAEAARVLDILLSDSWRAYDNYEAMLSQDGQQGLSRELARMVLPANIYTQMYWKIDLHNLFHFLRLRADPHAQSEIRAYADVIGGIVADWVPAAWAAFQDYRLNAASLSGPMLACLRRILAGEAVTQATSGLSSGDWRAFMAAIGRGAEADQVVSPGVTGRELSLLLDDAFELAAKFCEREKEAFMSDKYAPGQPWASSREQLACDRCAEAIRALKKHQPKEETDA